MEMSQSILKTIPRWPGTIFNKSKISVKTFYLWKHIFCNLFLVKFFNTHTNMITRNMTNFHYSLTQGCAVRSLKNLLYGTARLISSKSSIFWGVCPIQSGTLENWIWSIQWKISSFDKWLILIISEADCIDKISKRETEKASKGTVVNPAWRVT